METLKAIPTNIITGALGVGKTTVIRSFLANKPDHERWAVLVNEFGEVGIDGAIMVGKHEPGVYIKEVPGGCMCCTSGLPMQIALNLLLAQAKPHRLLIEPTGLGHPKEVLQTLSAEHYKDVLDINGTLTLIDVRKLADRRWRAHQTFQQQIQIADAIVVTKSDLYTEPFAPALDAYLADVGVKGIPIVEADKGSIDNIWLTAKYHKHQLANEAVHMHSDHDHDHDHDHPAAVLAAPVDGTISVRNQGEGYYSRGWICARSRTFDFDQVDNVFKCLDVERLKAVLITNLGIFSFNLAADQYEVSKLSSAQDSRIEFIVASEAVADDIAASLTQSLSLS